MLFHEYHPLGGFDQFYDMNGIKAMAFNGYSAISAEEAQQGRESNNSRQRQQQAAPE